MALAHAGDSGPPADSVLCQTWDQPEERDKKLQAPTWLQNAESKNEGTTGTPGPSGSH